MGNEGQAPALEPFRSDEIPETVAALTEMRTVLERLQQRMSLIGKGDGSQAAHRAGEAHDALQRLEWELSRHFLQPYKG